MIVRELKLRNFRNHADSTVTLGSGINALLGENGQGKTNVLEAVSFLGLTKSFYASSDVDVLKFGTDFFSIEGLVEADGGSTSAIRVVYRKNPSDKQITVNALSPESHSRMIGRFPVVVLSPEHARITWGGPVERRKFMDLTLSQVSASYLDDLFDYRRALRQRNRLLFEAKTGTRGVVSQIEPWTEHLAASGGRIIARRLSFIEEFASYVTAAYAMLVDGKEQPSMQYAPLPGVVSGMSSEECARHLTDELHRRALDELRRAATLAGPHRDDIDFSLDGMLVQKFASQGQHKTLLVALKLAEHQYVFERCNERPMLLLDDLFSELDAPRAARILDRIRTIGQTIVTTTEETPFHGSVGWDNTNRKYFVRHGTIFEA